MMNKLSRNAKLTFHNKLFGWWELNKRTMPWRKTNNPYKIMVSEFMLQQTQVKRVVPKYSAWIKHFPTPKILAQASNHQILTIWQGLGYNRRAIWLKEAAKLIDEDFSWTPENLIKIKGIGAYTSRAIPIFAFNCDLATVDTNIRNVLILEKFIDEVATTKQIWETAKKLLPKGKSRDYHNALMDYGSTLKSYKTQIKRPRNKIEGFLNSSRDFRGRVIKVLVKNRNLSIENHLFKMRNTRNRNQHCPERTNK